MVEVGLADRPKKETSMPELQRLASIGWRRVLNTWDQAIRPRKICELLMTQHDLNIVSEREEALRVTHTLLSHGDVPIVNDNDMLAATFAAKIGQSALFGNKVQLVLLSDIDGVYANRSNPDLIVPIIEDTEAFEHLVGNADSDNWYWRHESKICSFKNRCLEWSRHVDSKW